MSESDLNIAQKISQRIKKKDPSAIVWLFGSHARGDAREDSDWDILVLIDHPKKDRSQESKYRDEIFNLELDLGVPISTFIFSKSDWESKYAATPFYENVQHEGIKLK